MILTDLLDSIGLAIHARLDARYGGRYWPTGENGTQARIVCSVPLAGSAQDRLDFAWHHALQYETVRLGDMRARYPGLSPEALRRDLVKLADEGYLEPVGRNRGRYYRLVLRDEGRDERPRRGRRVVSHG
jgi:hypothetical protein